MQFGIEALTMCPKKNQTEKHCDFCMMAPSFVSIPSDASWVVGDYIGMESCFDLYDNEQVSGAGCGVCSESRVKREQPRKMEKRELPLPLPWLARTQNQPSHMPWVLKRYYTNDGRLILREEKAKPHEYLRAHRSNGRLTLQLVPFEDTDNDNYETKEEDRDDIEDSMVKSPIAESNTVDKGMASNGGKCMNYSSVRTRSTCFLGMPVSAIRPVHS